MASLQTVHGSQFSAMETGHFNEMFKRIAVALFIYGVVFCAGSSSLMSKALSFDDVEYESRMIEIAPLSQMPDLPTGCEAVAATMLLQWAGIEVEMNDVAYALPKGNLPEENEDGAVVGGNPEHEFVGDPYSVGYGIYHEPLAKVLEDFAPGRVKDMTGGTFDELLDTVYYGNPVLVWATERMDYPYLSTEWEDYEGNLVNWYEPEHALLLVGWDDDYAYMNDPMTGNREAYNLWQFKDVWEMMGSQAITLTL